MVSAELPDFLVSGDPEVGANSDGVKKVGRLTGGVALTVGIIVGGIAVFNGIADRLGQEGVSGARIEVE